LRRTGRSTARMPQLIPTIPKFSTQDRDFGQRH